MCVVLFNNLLSSCAVHLSRPGTAIRPDRPPSPPGLHWPREGGGSALAAHRLCVSFAGCMASLRWPRHADVGYFIGCFAHGGIGATRPGWLFPLDVCASPCANTTATLGATRDYHSGVIFIFSYLLAHWHYEYHYFWSDTGLSPFCFLVHSCYFCIFFIWSSDTFGFFATIILYYFLCGSYFIILLSYLYSITSELPFSPTSTMDLGHSMPMLLGFGT